MIFYVPLRIWIGKALKLWLRGTVPELKLAFFSYNSALFSALCDNDILNFGLP